MKKVAIVAALTLAGCSVIAPAIDKTAEETARIVDQYCSEVDEQVRLEIRDKVNGQLSNGNSILIECGNSE